MTVMGVIFFGFMQTKFSLPSAVVNLNGPKKSDLFLAKKITNTQISNKLSQGDQKLAIQPFDLCMQKNHANE